MSIQATPAAAISFASNDYLGLGGHPGVIEAAVRATAAHGTGSSGSRGASAVRWLVQELEERLASFFDVESALVFQSGYLATLGLVSSLAGPKDVVLRDELDHPSSRDGIQLAGARALAYQHRDIDHLADLLAHWDRTGRGSGGHILVMTDGVFGSEGEIAPLPDIAYVAERFGATVILDDAHGTGVLGQRGRGTMEHFGLPASGHVTIGSLSKALGGAGGYVTGDTQLCSAIATKANQVLYSTLPPPATAAAAAAALRVIDQEPDRIARLRSNTRFLREHFTSAGYDLGDSETAIVPLYMRTQDAAQAFAASLRQSGITVSATTSPARPESVPRLRFIVRADHQERQLEACARLVDDLEGRTGAVRRAADGR